MRHTLARQLQLVGGDIDAGDAKALCQPLQRRHARAAAEVEHGSLIGQPGCQLLELRHDDLFAGGFGCQVLLSDPVVSGFHCIAWVHYHSACR